MGKHLQITNSKRLSAYSKGNNIRIYYERKRLFWWVQDEFVLDIEIKKYWTIGPYREELNPMQMTMWGTYGYVDHETWYPGTLNLDNRMQQLKEVYLQRDHEEVEAYTETNKLMA